LNNKILTPLGHRQHVSTSANNMNPQVPEICVLVF